MKRQVGIFFILSLLCIVSCNMSTREVAENELVRYGNEVLTLDQISVPSFYNASDSVDFVKNKINEWIIRQALAEKAFENISDKDKSIERQVNEYRTTLFIHAYKQMLLNQKIDNNIPPQQIKEYYDKFREELKLNYPIVRAMIVQISISNTNREQILRLLKQEDEKSFADLKELCYQNSRHYNLNGEWCPLAELFDETPFTPQNINTNNISKGKIYHNNQNEMDTYVKIIDFKKAGDEPPLEYISDRIKEILLRKRKEQFLTKLENDLVQNALNQNKIVFQNN